VSDIGWFTSAGGEMSDEDWRAGFAKSLGVFLNGRAIPTLNERGEPVTDDSFYVMFNAHHEPLEFTLPERPWGDEWTQVLSTAEEKDLLAEQEDGPRVAAGSRMQVQPWSLVLLRQVSPKEPEPGHGR
jgi:glycogen operon protein